MIWIPLGKTPNINPSKILQSGETWGMKFWAEGWEALLVLCVVGSNVGRPWEMKEKNCFAAAQHQEKPGGIDLQ